MLYGKVVHSRCIAYRWAVLLCVAIVWQRTGEYGNAMSLHRYAKYCIGEALHGEVAFRGGTVTLCPVL